MKTWEEVENLFGRVPDTEIADLVGKSKEAVRQQRTKRGIPVYRHRLQFTDEMRAALGTDSDEAIAKRFGVSITRIKLARRAAGIPLPPRKSELRKALEAIDWDNDIRTDGEIAEALATCTSTVCRIRNEIGIPNSTDRGRPSAHTVTPYERLQHGDVDLTPYLCIFPHTTNVQLQEYTGIPARDIGRIKREMGIKPRKRTYEVDWRKALPMLTTKRDSAIAKDLGIPASIVYGVRRNLNLPAYSPNAPSMPQRILADAGQAEEEVAEKHSVTASYVRFIRKFCSEEDR